MVEASSLSPWMLTAGIVALLVLFGVAGFLVGRSLRIRSGPGGDGLQREINVDGITYLSTASMTADEIKALIEQAKASPDGTVRYEVLNAQTENFNVPPAFSRTESIRIHRVNRRVTVEVNGTIYSNPDDIQDKETRDRVRTLLQNLPRLS